jgi:hypothetical protein
MASSGESSSQAGSLDHQTTGKIRGRVKVKHAKVALLLERGEPVSVVAKKTGLSEGRIYHLLEDEKSFLNNEIQRIRHEKHEAQEGLLENIHHNKLQLLSKALEQLDLILESPDIEKRERYNMIKLIISRLSKTSGSPPISRVQPLEPPKNIWEARKFFQEAQKAYDEACEVCNGYDKHINEIILKKRRERGLPDFPKEDEL